jgi:hypothetical protein
VAAKLIFSMQNNFAQGQEQGIGTCSALRWARQTLRMARGLNSYAELGLDNQTMNAQMAVLRKYDNDPAKQCELAQVEPVGKDMVNTPPSVAIFWTNNHTMGYRYAHLEKEFFDIEKGLWRAKHTSDIEDIMKKTIAGYGPVVGLRVVRLPK